MRTTATTRSITVGLMNELIAVNVYRVESDHLAEKHDQACAKLGAERTPPRELYHGTSVRSIQLILQNKFALPPASARMGFNMFGSGIHFVDNQKKSWAFSTQNRAIRAHPNERSITSNPKCLTTPKTKGSSRDRFVTIFTDVSDFLHSSTFFLPS